MAGRQVLPAPYQTPSAPDVAAARPRALRRLAAAATGATFLLIAVGGLVRASGSGLGCPGWPKCFGRWIPPLEAHAIIEYSHRFTATVVIVLVGTLAVVAWRHRRAGPATFRLAAAAFVLVLFQAALGGIVVKGDLHALLVTAHFATAMLLVGVLMVATVAAFASGPAASLPGLTRPAIAAAAYVFVLLLVGAAVRGDGAGLAFRDWPLMGGGVLPDLGHRGAALMLAHRLLAAGALVVVPLVARRARGARRERPVAWTLGAAAVGLLLLQVLIGAAAVWTRLAAATIVAHVTVSSLVWGSLVGLAATSFVAPPVRTAPVDAPSHAAVADGGSS